MLFEEEETEKFSTTSKSKPNPKSLNLPKDTKNSKEGSSLDEDFIFDPTPNSSTATHEEKLEEKEESEKMKKLLKKYRNGKPEPKIERIESLSKSHDLYNTDIKKKLKEFYNPELTSGSEHNSNQKNNFEKVIGEMNNPEKHNEDENKKKNQKPEKNFLKRNKEDFRTRMSEEKRRVIKLAKEKKKQIKEMRKVKEIQIELENKRKREDVIGIFYNKKEYLKNMNHSCNFFL